MGNDAREIYEAVMGEVKKDLAKMVPQYEERILLSVEQKVMGQLSELVRKNEELEGQLNTLKVQINSIVSLVNEVSTKMSTISGEERVSVLEFGDDFEIASVNEMLQYYRARGFEFNGWIYYTNPSMGNFMYKIRINGKDVQQVTDYSVKDIQYNAKVKNGKLYFVDCDNYERTIDL